VSRLIVYSVQISGTKEMSFFSVFERVVFAGLRKGITRLERFIKRYPSVFQNDAFDFGHRREQRR
jgi:hypothetical protein